MKKSAKYFVKSFEEDFILKTLRNKKKVDFQSVDNILKKKIIKPNTRSFGRKKRLACTYLSKNYLKTYRSQGIIFQTSESPDYVYPFDLVILTDAKKIIVQYYRIKENLHKYYGHELISGFDKFMFKSPEEMLKKISSPNVAWKKANEFRAKAGYVFLPKSKYKLVEYNEVVFNRPIKIKPLAVFGYRKIAKDIAKKYSLPHFRTVKDFYNSLK